MSNRCALLLCLLLGALTLISCAPLQAPVAPSAADLIHPGMTETVILERLGAPALITEQPRTRVRVPTPTGIEFREKRRYTYYYHGASQRTDLLVIFEDGVVVETGGRRHR